MPKWKQATIIDIIDITDQQRIVRLRPEEKIDLLDFQAGQFVTFDLPIGEKRLDRWRSYSIANLMHQDQYIELCIVKVPNGKASEFLFEKIKIGDQLVFKGPQGSFVLPSEIKRDLLMICTGTGIAPFRAMILEALFQRKTSYNIHLIFGTRTEKDILYRQEMETLAEEYDHFEYTVALSREVFKGYQGYVHGIYKKMNVDALRNKSIYICGWQNMIDECIDTLTNEWKVPRENIFFELYG